LSELTSSGNLALSDGANEGLSGGGLADCDDPTASKLLWNVSTNKFSCGADQNSGSATAWDAINNPSGAGDIAMAETAQTLDWNTADTAAAFDGLTITLTNDATTDSNIQRALVIQNTDAAGSTDTERLLVLDNADITEAVVTALEITSAAGTITTAIDVSDAEIGTALAIGSNDITTSGGTIITSTELDIVDSGIVLSELTSTGNLALSVGASEGLSGGGLTDCNNATTSKLLWDSATNKFSCGADQNSGGSSVWSDLDTPTGVLSVAHAEFATTFTWNTADTAAAFDGITLALTNDATTDANTQRVLVVQNNEAGGTTDTERLVWLNNADTTEAVVTALEITSEAGTITTAIDVSDGEIGTALSAGPNTIAITTGTIGSNSTSVIDFEDFDVTADGLITVANDADGVALTVTPSVGTTTAIDVSDGNITNAISIGANAIAGTNFDVTEAGAITGVSLDAGSGTIQTTGSVLGNAIDRTAGGALTIGNTTATSVSICNSDACDTIEIGTNTDADTITIGDSSNLDTFSIYSTGFKVTTDGAVSDVTSLATTGGWTQTGAAPSITIDAASTLSISNGTDTFSINTDTNTLNFDDGSGNSFVFDIDAGTGPVYSGSAMPTKKITLIPEFPGATLTGDGTSNVGTMTSDFCSKTNTNPPDINTGVCVTAGDLHNYYSWTAQATNDYDIWIPWQVPSDFGEFASSTAIQFYGLYGSDQLWCDCGRRHDYL